MTTAITGRPAADSRTRRVRRVLRDERVRTWAGLAPALTIVVVLFGGALTSAVRRSLIGAPTAAGGASLDGYRRLFTDPEFVGSLGLTLYIAVAATGLAVVLGVAAALLLYRLDAGRRLATTVFQLNLPLPHVIGAVAVLALIGQSGLVSRSAAAAGLIEGPSAFPALVFDTRAVGVILHYVWKEVPFIGIVALAILRAGGDDLEEAAHTLGAGRWQRLRHVTLPLLLPGVLSASLIVFAFTFGTFEVPLLLGPDFPATLPVLAYRRYTATDLATRPEAMAIGVVIAVLALAVVLGASALARRSIRGDAA